MDEFVKPAEMIMRFLVENERQQIAEISREVEQTFTIMLKAQIESHTSLKANALQRADFVRAAHHQVMVEAYSAILKNHSLSSFTRNI